MKRTPEILFLKTQVPPGHALCSFAVYMWNLVKKADPAGIRATVVQ